MDIKELLKVISKRIIIKFPVNDKWAVVIEDVDICIDSSTTGSATGSGDTIIDAIKNCCSKIAGKKVRVYETNSVEKYYTINIPKNIEFVDLI